MSAADDMRQIDRHDFRSKPAALRKVAGVTAALIGSGDESDLFGYNLDLTETQRERMWWAIEEVQRRLYKMGGPAE